MNTRGQRFLAVLAHTPLTAEGTPEADDPQVCQ